MPAPFFLVLGGAVLIAFGYLWLDQRCAALGRRLSQLDTQKSELQRQVKQERSRWESAKSLDQVEKLLQRHHLTMTWPDERSIVRIRRAAEEPSATETAAPRHQFARAGGIAND
ncbi:MAG: hypothetical protein NTY53_17155 [Kiritimatiellaeota bacterium]|nr:hypothetical protein [Kiritimatiellota bacterium]